MPVEGPRVKSDADVGIGIGGGGIGIGVITVVADPNFDQGVQRCGHRG